MIRCLVKHSICFSLGALGSYLGFLAINLILPGSGIAITIVTAAVGIIFSSGFSFFFDYFLNENSIGAKDEANEKAYEEQCNLFGFHPDESKREII